MSVKPGLVQSDSIFYLKTLWFKSTLGVDNTKYLDVALDIDNMIGLKERYKSSFSFGRRQALDLLFSLESKNRVLVMFMGISAAVTALSISSGSRLEDIFSFFYGETLTSLLGLVFSIAIMFMLLILVVRYALILVAIVFENLFDLAGGVNSTSRRRASNFINQLISLYELEKARVGIKGSGGENP